MTNGRAEGQHSPYALLGKVPFRMGHLRLAYRWSRYFMWSATHGHPQGMRDAVRGLSRLVRLSLKDAFRHSVRVQCNVCGWEGVSFYPNVGSGYFELESNCPRCSCNPRYRSLVAVLDAYTNVFSPDTGVIEVAPVRSFQAYCLQRKKGNSYVTFDLEHFGMEKGDLTAMRFESDFCDYFLCFHVLEHVPDDVAAVREIFRVLRPGGQAVLQVPIDHALMDTVEYGRSNPRETGHVRRYSETGFAERLKSMGFRVAKVSVDEFCPAADIDRFGLSREPIYFAKKPIRAV